MATKQENINTLRILLELDSADAKDLEKLKPETLDHMRISYTENALRTNIKMTDEHINKSLPIVGPFVLVLVDGEYVEAKRKNFITTKDFKVEFVGRDGKSFYLNKNRIFWKYL